MGHAVVPVPTDPPKGVAHQVGMPNQEGFNVYSPQHFTHASWGVSSIKCGVVEQGMATQTSHTIKAAKRMAPKRLRAILSWRMAIARYGFKCAKKFSTHWRSLCR